MKLWKAPTIIDRIKSSAIDAAAAKVRAEFDTATTDGGDLKKLAQDIWAIDGPLGLHTDATAPKHWVFGLVLINEPGLLLFAENVLYDFPVGTIYAIDGRRRHGVLAHNRVTKGLLAFLAWDVPRLTPVDELIADLCPSLQAWADGEERINVLPQ
jgi:hypothetical protein